MKASLLKARFLFSRREIYECKNVIFSSSSSSSFLLFSSPYLSSPILYCPYLYYPYLTLPYLTLPYLWSTNVSKKIRNPLELLNILFRPNCVIASTRACSNAYPTQKASPNGLALNTMLFFRDCFDYYH